MAQAAARQRPGLSQSKKSKKGKTAPVTKGRRTTTARGRQLLLDAETQQAAASVTVTLEDDRTLTLPTVQIAATKCASALGSDTALAQWIGVSRGQPGRWRRALEVPSPTAARLLIDLAYVVDRAHGVWGSQPALTSWLHGSDALLDGASPLTLISRGDVTSVAKALDGHLAGSYA